ncbi:hypothetical protein B0O79_1405 [Flavobacteriaceae bacterium MAR_2009_75]|nr:hypothetical protein B0O79_1405 [Flavobacteriaceae bacterium MAR_2009_75]
MKKIALVVSFVLFIFCQPRDEGNLMNTAIESDSISYYYQRAKNKDLSLEDRSNAIQHAYSKLNPRVYDSIFGEVLYYKNYIHLNLGQYDSLLNYSNLLLLHKTEINSSTVLAKHYYLLAYYYQQITRDYGKAIENYTASKNYALKLNDSSLAGKNLMNIGVIQKNQNDFFGSKETLVEALTFLKEPSLTTYCYNALATDHRKLLNYEEAIYYYGKAITEASGTEEKLLYENNLAATYIDDADYNKAISLLSTVSKRSERLKNKKLHARVLDNLAYARWLSGALVNEQEFLASVRIRKEENDRRGLLASYTHLGEFFSKTRPKVAKTYLDSVIQLSQKLKIPRAETDALQFLMPLEPSNVNLRDRYVYLQDSLYEQELKVKTQFAKYIYDDQLKQESIQRLQRANLEHELEATKQRSQSILLTSSLVVVVLAALFISLFMAQRSKRLRQKNRTAKIEAAYETEAALSRKLHDDFGGKLNHAMVLLQNGSDRKDVLDMVGDLYDQSRRFSREINDVDTGPSFKDNLFGVLEAYSKNIQLFVTGSKEVDWTRISPLSKKTLYRVLQELMINMQKHSKATMVFIDFQQTSKNLKISYSDNGVGTAKTPLKNKNGLLNTEKRIHAVKGTLIFDSNKGEGFNANIKIPN